MSAAQPQSPMFDKIAIIGIGLIGSSIARAARKHKLAKHVAIADSSEEARRIAAELKLGESVHADPGEAAKDADLTLVCVPIGAYAEVGQAIAPHLKSGSILSDVGSVKQAVLRDLGPLVPDHVHFIPGHPLAGTEKSGPDAGFADLFRHGEAELAHLHRQFGGCADLLHAEFRIGMQVAIQRHQLGHVGANGFIESRGRGRRSQNGCCKKGETAAFHLNSPGLAR